MFKTTLGIGIKSSYITKVLARFKPKFIIEEESSSTLIHSFFDLTSLMTALGIASSILSVGCLFKIENISCLAFFRKYSICCIITVDWIIFV